MLLHYLGKQRTWKPSFHSNIACFLSKIQETHFKISPGHNWTPLTVKRSTVCTRQDLGRENSIIQYVTLTLGSYQVCHWQSLCQKWKSFLSSIRVKVNGQYCCDILLSQQMLYATIVSFIRNLSFSKTVHLKHLASTAAVQNSQPPFSWAVTPQQSRA